MWVGGVGRTDSYRVVRNFLHSSCYSSKFARIPGLDHPPDKRADPLGLHSPFLWLWRNRMTGVLLEAYALGVLRLGCVASEAFLLERLKFSGLRQAQERIPPPRASCGLLCSSD